MYIKKTCEEMTENKRLKKSDIIDFPSGHPHHSSLLLLLEVDTCENLTSVRTPEFDPDCRFRFLGPNPRSYVIRYDGMWMEIIMWIKPRHRWIRRLIEKYFFKHEKLCDKIEGKENGQRPFPCECMDAQVSPNITPSHPINLTHFNCGKFIFYSQNWMWRF